MKSLSLFISFLFFFISTIKGQEQVNQTYRITDNGSVKDVQPYIDALNKANMKYHRLRNTRYTITFETGVKVELFSATELIAAGKNINSSDYPESFDATRQEPVFLLGNNNFIIEQRQTADNIKRSH